MLEVFFLFSFQVLAVAEGLPGARDNPALSQTFQRTELPGGITHFNFQFVVACQGPLGMGVNERFICSIPVLAQGELQQAYQGSAEMGRSAWFGVLTFLAF